jgi:hypothetical protein
MRVARMLIAAGLTLFVGGIIWGFSPVVVDGPCGSVFVQSGDGSEILAPTCGATVSMSGC